MLSPHVMALTLNTFRCGQRETSKPSSKSGNRQLAACVGAKGRFLLHGDLVVVLQSMGPMLRL
jgi:hypothetical protein